MIKGINEKYTHKSDIGGVVLNVKNKDELLYAANKIIDNFGKHSIEMEKFLHSTIC